MTIFLKEIAVFHFVVGEYHIRNELMLNELNNFNITNHKVIHSERNYNFVFIYFSSLKFVILHSFHTSRKGTLSIIPFSIK